MCSGDCRVDQNKQIFVDCFTVLTKVEVARMRKEIRELKKELKEVNARFEKWRIER